MINYPRSIPLPCPGVAMTISHPWFNLLNSPKKTAKRGFNQLLSRQLILECLEERAAPGDLLGVGLTQAAMFTSARPGISTPSISAPTAKPTTAPANSAPTISLPYGVIAAGLTAPSRLPPSPQAPSAPSTTNPDLWNAFDGSSRSGATSGSSSLPSGSQNAITVGAGLLYWCYFRNSRLLSASFHWRGHRCLACYWNPASYTTFKIANTAAPYWHQSRHGSSCCSASLKSCVYHYFQRYLARYWCKQHRPDYPIEAPYHSWNGSLRHAGSGCQQRPNHWQCYN